MMNIEQNNTMKVQEPRYLKFAKSCFYSFSGHSLIFTSKIYKNPKMGTTNDKIWSENQKINHISTTWQTFPNRSKLTTCSLDEKGNKKNNEKVINKKLNRKWIKVKKLTEVETRRKEARRKRWSFIAMLIVEPQRLNLECLGGDVLDGYGGCGLQMV